MMTKTVGQRRSFVDVVAGLFRGLFHAIGLVWLCLVANLFASCLTLKVIASVGLLSPETFVSFVVQIQPAMRFVAHGLSLVQLGAMMWFLLGSRQLCDMFHASQPPAWVSSVEQQNAMQHSILVFVILPQFVNQFYVP